MLEKFWLFVFIKFTLTKVINQQQTIFTLLEMFCLLQASKGPPPTSLKPSSLSPKEQQLHLHLKQLSRKQLKQLSAQLPDEDWQKVASQQLQQLVKSREAAVRR